MKRTADDGFSSRMSDSINHALAALNKYVDKIINTLRISSSSVGVLMGKNTAPTVAAIVTYLSRFKSHPHCELAFIFLSHVAMLEIVPLQDRAQADYYSSLSPTLNSIVHREFLPRLYTILSRIDTSGIDIIDGRLFGRMLWEFTNPESKLDPCDPIIQKTQEFWKATTHLDLDLDLDHLRTTYSRISTPIIPDKVEPRSSLKPFSQPALSQYLLDPTILPESSSSSLEVDDAVGFRASLRHTETTHWHSKREILPNGAKTAPEQPNKWLQSRRLRKDQKYRASMQRYAESMAGQGLHQITIVRDTTKPKTTTKPVIKEKKAGGKPKPLSKKEQIIANNKKVKFGEERKKAISSIQELERTVRKMETGDIDKKVASVDKAIKLAKEKGDGRMVVELHVLKIREYLAEWDIVSRARAVKFDDIAWLPVEIYRSTQSIYLSSYSSGPTFEKLKIFLHGLGIPVPTSTKKIEEIHDEALPFDFPMNTKSRIPCSSEEFQLRFCGPYMEKALDAKPDDRVQFVPDGWQRKVLDILDKNESVIAVAPTSAGKTFIAYYAMEKILRGDDDGVLVYIAPTKALVNQIGAEVYARFAKKYPSAGSTIWAIHTRDYRINNPYGCQILVTVPEVTPPSPPTFSVCLMLMRQ
jgi:hypothetical protein